MAVRYRKGRASPWQCYWNNPLTGKRECANFATQLEAEKHDSRIKHRIKFERESFQGEEKEEKESTELTLEACFLLYLREKQFKPKGIRWQMEGMRIPLQIFGTKSIHSIDYDDITHIAQLTTATGVKTVTIKKRISTLKTLFKWCEHQGYCIMPKFPKLPTGKYEKFIPPSPEEIQAMLMAAPAHIVRVIILGAQFGVRVGPSELMQLTWDDVDFERRILRVHGSKKNINSPWREVPIREGLLPVFRAWQEEDKDSPAPYIVHYHGKPIQSIKKAWAGMLQRAGITRRIRPYDLRHAFGTELIAAGADVGTVANLMGHSNPTMLLTHYQYVLDKQKRQAIESLPPIEYVSKNMCPKEEALTAMQ